jgi:hypothetical protein
MSCEYTKRNLIVQPITGATPNTHINNLFNNNTINPATGKKSYFNGIKQVDITNYLTDLFNTYQYAIPISNTSEEMKIKTWNEFFFNTRGSRSFLDDKGKVKPCLFNEWRDNIIYHLEKLERKGDDGFNGDPWDPSVKVWHTDNDAMYILDYLLYKTYRKL